MDLKIWWDEDSDTATIVTTPAELDEVLTRASALDYAIVLEILDANDPGRVILDVGLDGPNGVLYYSGGEHKDGYFSKNNDADLSSSERVMYDYMTNGREYPATAVCNVGIVFQAAREYMESDGARPTVVDWQPRSVLRQASN